MWAVRRARATRWAAPTWGTAVTERLTLDDVNFFDPEIQECPYDAYEVLRDEAPVWHDPRTGMYVVSRYDDLRALLLDTEHFGNSRPIEPLPRAPATPSGSSGSRPLYEEKGWVPAPTLAGRDDPEHRQMRALFDHAFRPAKIKQLDPFVEDLAHRLIDAFIDEGRCDWVRQFAVPLPLIVIGKQMGAPEEDIWRIKAWTDAWVQRLGMMQTDEEAIWSTEMEIEAQHYFQPIFERLRREPDDTLLSDVVNTPVAEWGRCLTDNELHAEMMADTFVGGSETSTNALSAGVMLLIENPRAWEQLKADPDTYLPTLRRGGAAARGAGAGPVPRGPHRDRAPRRHHPRGRGAQHPLRRGQPRRAPLRVPRRPRPRPGQRPVAPGLRRRHPLLPRSTARPPRAVPRVQGPGGAHRRAVVRRRGQRLPPRPELLPPGPEGAAHRLHPGGRAEPDGGRSGGPSPSRVAAGRGDHLVDEGCRLAQLDGVAVPLRD